MVGPQDTYEAGPIGNGVIWLNSRNQHFDNQPYIFLIVHMFFYQPISSFYLSTRLCVSWILQFFSTLFWAAYSGVKTKTSLFIHEWHKGTCRIHEFWCMSWARNDFFSGQQPTNKVMHCQTVTLRCHMLMRSWVKISVQQLKLGTCSGWWFQFFSCSPLFGEDFPFD